jgi:L-aspartate oxidase
MLLEDPTLAEKPMAWSMQHESNVIAIEEHVAETANRVDRKDLQKLMWDAAGIERSAEGLRQANVQLSQWHSDGTSVEALETANLLCLARVLVAAALERRESRGAHFRNDYPEASDAERHSRSFARKVAVAC